MNIVDVAGFGSLEAEWHRVDGPATQNYVHGRIQHWHALEFYINDEHHCHYGPAVKFRHLSKLDDYGDSYESSYYLNGVYHKPSRWKKERFMWHFYETA